MWKSSAHGSLLNIAAATGQVADFKYKGLLPGG